MPVFTTKIDKTLAIHYRDLLKEEDCVFLIPQYTIFQAKNKNWQMTFYQSGKVVVQGKEIDYITQKYFGAGACTCQNEEGDIAPYPHIGIDESGKGDFFGPLVIAGCRLTKENAEKFKSMGAMDSKKLDDKKILALSNEISSGSIHEVIIIGNKKYNELYLKFKNLNKLLAWGHATVLENILNKIECQIAISDKFADEKVIQNALKEKGKKINLIQRPKAEIDTAVACASILARAAYVRKMSYLSSLYEMELPKGAGENVLIRGEKFVKKFGIEELNSAAKIHFKTYENIRALFC